MHNLILQKATKIKYKNQTIIDKVNLENDFLILNSNNQLFQNNLKRIQTDETTIYIRLVEESNNLALFTKEGSIYTIDVDELKLNSSSSEHCDAQLQLDFIGKFEFGIQLVRYFENEDLFIVVINTENGKKSILKLNSSFEILAETGELNYTNINDVSLKLDGSKIICNCSIGDQKNEIIILDLEDLALENVCRKENGGALKHLGASVSASRFLIASSIHKKHCEIQFFEPNGLEHGNFKLQTPYKNTQVACLRWNESGELLAVALTCYDDQESNLDSNQKVSEFSDDKSQITIVQLYHRNNYHWYLKYATTYVNEDVLALNFLSDLKLEVSKSTSIDTLDFHWSVSRNFNGGVWNIDGNLLHYTDLTKALIPPPFSAQQLNFDSPVTQLCNIEASHSAVVQLLNGEIYQVAPKVEGEITLSSSILARTPENWTSCRHLTNRYGHNFLCVISNATSEYIEELVEFEITDDGNIHMLNSLQLDLPVLTIASENNYTIVELEDGSLLEYAGSLVIPLSYSMMEPCPHLSVVQFHLPDDAVTTEDHVLIFGQTQTGRLYFKGDVLLHPVAVSSYVVSPTHQCILFVTLTSQLFIVSLETLEDYDPMENGPDELLASICLNEVRAVERGSKLVLVDESSPNLVMCMPRGNLEGICPRGLALPFVRRLIDQLEYKQAFLLMRKHRIDLNFLVDYAPRVFLENARSFVQQVSSCSKDYLNLFIASLHNYDITAIKYILPKRIQAKRVLDGFEFDSKVNDVCARLRREMMELDMDLYLLPILSTFAKQDPPKLEDALLLIQETASSSNLSLLSEKIQSSIQYVAFLADYELLFNTALGMYDFDLAKAVARNSQKDPKLYLPLLTKFKEFPVNIGKYEVDLYLNRYESALHHLAVSEDELKTMTTTPSDDDAGFFSKCLDHITTYKLHKAGLSLFHGQEERRSILQSFGEQLLKDRKPLIALSIFLSAKPKLYEGAKAAARTFGDWKTYFSCCREAGDSDESIIEVAPLVAEEMASGINTVGRLSPRECFNASAEIYYDYCNDIDEAVRMLISAENWAEGRRLAALEKREDLIDDVLHSAVDYSRQCVADLRKRSETFMESSERYIEVLLIQRKLKSELVTAGGTETTTADDSASLYTAASNMSNASLYSTASMGSVGSIASISSVISASTKSSFSVTVKDDYKHASKFNNIKKAKKKKKSKGGGRRVKKGSEEELNQIVSTLAAQCVSTDYLKLISDTIVFLCQEGKHHLALEIVEALEELCSCIDDSKDRRDEDIEERKSNDKEDAGDAALWSEEIVLPCEKTVDELKCHSLTDDVIQMVKAFS